MCNDKKISRGNLQSRGIIGLVPEWKGERGYNALTSSTLYLNSYDKINFNQSTASYDNYTKQDEFDLNNWLRSTLSSEDHVEDFLRHLSPKNKKQLMGIVLTSKDGEGGAPEATHYLGPEINIDDILEMANVLGAMQQEVSFKKEVMTLQLKLAKKIKNTVDAQKMRKGIISSYYFDSQDKLKSPLSHGIGDDELKRIASSIDLKTLGFHPFPLEPSIIYWYDAAHEEFKPIRKNYTLVLDESNNTRFWESDNGGVNIKVTPRENKMMNMIYGWVEMKQRERGQIID